MMLVMVLGGQGFIGSHLVRSLLSLGHHVRCFVRADELTELHGNDGSKNLEIFKGDFISRSSIEEAMQGIDICFHLISTTLPKSSNADPIFDVETNVLSSVYLLQCAVRFGVKKVVFASSGGTVYGVPRYSPIDEEHPTDPICSYGISKLAIEKYLALFHSLYGLDYAVLRIANPFGEGQRVNYSQGVVAVFLGKVLRGEPVEIWGDGSIIRDYVYISDVVDALVLAAEKETRSKVFNIGAGRGYSLNEVLDVIESVTGKVAKRCYLPARSFDVEKSVLCINRARDILGWVPKFSFEHGVTAHAKWVSEALFRNKL